MSGQWARSRGRGRKRRMIGWVRVEVKGVGLDGRELRDSIALGWGVVGLFCRHKYC